MGERRKGKSLVRLLSVQPPQTADRCTRERVKLALPLACEQLKSVGVRNDERTPLLARQPFRRQPEFAAEELDNVVTTLTKSVSDEANRPESLPKANGPPCTVPQLEVSRLE